MTAFYVYSLLESEQTNIVGWHSSGTWRQRALCDDPEREKQKINRVRENAKINSVREKERWNCEKQGERWIAINTRKYAAFKS